ncbi:MAG: NUDIX hydrolase [Dehalococcoidia bacterium]|nr:NUDIX hydrolase [Dehalococcoidia bacterium]
MSTEKTIESQRLYEGRIINLRLDTIELPDGRTAKREIVEHRGAVAIVAIDENDNVLLVRQFRTPVGGVLLEVPAGTLDPGEKPEDCARRELQEETGFAAGHIERLGGFYSAPGFCTEYLYLYLATELTPSRLEADYDENIEVEKVPLSEVHHLITSEKIRDAKSVGGLLLTLFSRSGKPT